MNERDAQDALGLIQYRKYVLNDSSYDFYYIFMECVDDVHTNEWVRDIVRKYDCWEVTFYIYSPSEGTRAIFDTEVGEHPVDMDTLVVRDKFTDEGGYRAILIGK